MKYDIVALSEFMTAERREFLCHAESALEAGYNQAVEDPLPLGGSEGFSFMMNRVAARGGKALFVVLGTKLAGAHHAPKFDIREEGLPLGALAFARLTERLTAGPDGA